jgi:Abortive infection alpha
MLGAACNRLDAAPHLLNGHDVDMSEEIELASKTAGEMAGAVAEVLAEKSGALGPLRTRLDAVTAGIHYRYYPRTIEQAVKAAKQIEESRLPRQAIEVIPDALLRAILEGGAMENEEDLHDRWSSLLANALTEGSARVDRTFPDILRRLEPIEALALDALAQQANFSRSPEEQEFAPEELQATGIDGVGLDNLVGLMLLRYTRQMTTTVGTINDAGTSVAGATFTNLGWVFVQACREPVQPTENRAQRRG